MAAKKRTFLTLIDVFVSAGASVVIFAAWAKLTHQPFADKLLTLGMWTETAIFLVYAILEWVKPKSHDEDESSPAISETENPALRSVEQMLQEAEINPVNMKKLSESFQKLGTTVSNIHELGDVVKTTGDFSAKTKEATSTIGALSTAFAASAATMGSFNKASDSAQVFHEQIQVLTKNLGSLNTIYELELKESNNHLKTLNSFYGKMAEASQTMVGSVEDAHKAKDQISALANNLGKLNAVYGNMISAMQGGR
jgi:gliding motility-associated protein GldL